MGVKQAQSILAKAQQQQQADHANWLEAFNIGENSVKAADFKQPDFIRAQSENWLNQVKADAELSFSRVSQLDTRRVNLGELLGEVILLLSHKVNQKRLIVRKSFPDQPIQVSGEENKLKQLFINLFMNSVEAVLDHGQIDVAVQSDPEKGYAEVAITDNGYGIPREIQDRIFTPFFTTKMTKTNTGLGLSICQHIAEAHRGVITFHSVPGATTCFTVKLPLA